MCVCVCVCVCSSKATSFHVKHLQATFYAKSRTLHQNLNKEKLTSN